MPDKNKTKKLEGTPVTRNCKLHTITKERLLECAELFLDVFKNKPWNYTWLTKENTSRYFNDLFKTPNFAGFYYELNNAIIGVCMGVRNDYFPQKTYDIKEIFVRTDVQNRGIGSAMLSDIEASLSRCDIDAVALYTQRHLAAYNFYIKNGYFPSDETVYLCKILNM